MGTTGDVSGDAIAGDVRGDVPAENGTGNGN